MGLEERLNDNVELLSGGQRQALTLLMAVLSKPALLLLDEHAASSGLRQPHPYDGRRRNHYGY